MSRLQRLTTVTALLTWILVMSGGTVRVTGSGLGCPDWPLCHGQVIPPFEKETLIEYSHRLTASLVSVLVLVTAAAAWRAYRRNRPVLIPALLGVAFLAAQVVLGGITVLTELPPSIVTAHLATSMGLLACVVVTAAGAFATDPRRPNTRRPPVGTSFALLSALTAFTTYALLLTGAYVTAKGAGLACGGWPLCNGKVIPTGDTMAGIHAFHRLAAAAAGLLVALVLWRAFTARPRNLVITATAIAAGAAFVVQVLVGAGNIWLEMSQQIRVAHLGAAALVWGVLVLLTTLAFHAAGGAGEPVAGAGGDDPGETLRAERAQDILTARGNPR